MKKILTGVITSMATLIFLSGCATTFSSQVSVFHELTTGLPKNQTYIVERLPAQENNLEYKVYEEQLRSKLDTAGMQEADSTHPASIKVSFQYATMLNEVQYDNPLRGSPIYDPFWRVHFNRGYYYPRYAGVPYMMRMSELSVHSYYLHQLQINMADLASGKKLADIKVSSEQMNPEISLYMPYLIDSALKALPGKSGSTVKIEVPLEK